MFQLSQTHNQAFQAKAEVDFVREVMQYLRENHAKTIVKLPNGEFKVEDLVEDSLRKMVEGGISKARSYGMTWRNTIISFVVMMFVSSPNFDLYPKFSEVLKKSLLIESFKLIEMCEKYIESDWNNIAKDYDYFEWNTYGQ